MAVTPRELDTTLPDDLDAAPEGSTDPKARSMTDDTSATPEPDGAEEGRQAPATPLTKAERLEAKAARLREAEIARQQRAREAALRGTPPASARPWMVTAGVLAVLLVLTLALGVPYALRKRSAVAHDAQLNRDRVAVVALAEAFSKAAATYDYRDMQAAFAKQLSYMTPAYQQQWRRNTSQLGALAVQAKAVSTATIETYGVTSLTTKHAVVLVYFDQLVQNKSAKQPAHYRAIVTMDKQPNGKWLASNLDLK
jgi:hypothetical protein